MAIKQWMSIDQQSEILIKRRHLTANKNELNEILISENYFNFFNGLETIFLPVKYKHHISDKNFGHRHSIEEFKLVYKFDGNLETLISSKLRHFEQRLKTSVAYNFCAHHCYSLNDTMQYTNQDNFVDPACVSQFAFINDQNKDLSRHFNGGAYQEIGSDGTSNNRRYKKFNLFVNKYLDNLVDRNELIKENFYQDDSYFPPQNVAVYHNKPSVAVPFWVSIQYMTFGSMNVLCHFLNDNDIYSVLKDFKIPQDEFHKQVFLNTIDILVSLRNSCAHGNLISRYRSSSKIRIHNSLVRKYDLFVYSSDYFHKKNYILDLYGVLKILSIYENIEDIKETFLNFSHEFLFSQRGKTRKRRLKAYKNMLYRMGRKNNFYKNDKGTKKNKKDFHRYSDWINL